MITIKARRAIARRIAEREVEAAANTADPRKPAQSHLMAYLARQPPSLIGINACADAHDLAHELHRLGHAVKIIYPAFHPH